MRKHNELLSTILKKRLLLTGIAFVFLAYFTDCLLDALIFEDDSFWEQIIYPTPHEISIRFVFSTFILGVTWLGCHLLNLMENRERHAYRQVEETQKANRDLDAIHRAITIDMRSMVATVTTKTSFLLENNQAMDEKTLFNAIKDVEKELYDIEQLLDDLYQFSKD